MLSKAQANPARSANVVLCGDTTTTSVLDVGGCRSVICISSFIRISRSIAMLYDKNSTTRYFLLALGGKLSYVRSPVRRERSKIDVQW
jgi:hypothetical protein